MSPLKIGVPWKRRFRTWKPAFSGALAVSFREGINKAGKYHPLLTEDMKVGTIKLMEIANACVELLVRASINLGKL